VPIYYNLLKNEMREARNGIYDQILGWNSHPSASRSGGEHSISDSISDTHNINSVSASGPVHQSVTAFSVHMSIKRATFLVQIIYTHAVVKYILTINCNSGTVAWDGFSTIPCYLGWQNWTYNLLDQDLIHLASSEQAQNEFVFSCEAVKK
jgi:hypothetical protein